MKKPSSPHGTAAWLAVVRAYHLCEAVMSTRLTRLGVKLPEHEVLANLSTAPGITQQMLAERSFSAKSHTSMLLKQMEAAGLVRRDTDPADARAKLLFLTPAGAALASFLMALSIGVGFGALPALQAARLPPIDALRTAS